MALKTSLLIKSGIGLAAVGAAPASYMLFVHDNRQGKKEAEVDVRQNEEAVEVTAPKTSSYDDVTGNRLEYVMNVVDMEYIYDFNRLGAAYRLPWNYYYTYIEHHAQFMVAALDKLNNHPTLGSNRVTLEWWDWSYEYNYKAYKFSETEDSFFHKVSGENGIKDGQTLRKRCQEAYEVKRDGEELKKPSFEEQVWMFCSILDKKPKVVGYPDKNDRNSNSIMQVYGRTLMSTTDSDNERAWEVLNKRYKIKTPSYGFFGYAAIGAYLPKKDIRARCEKAYAEPHTAWNYDSSKIKLTYVELNRWCALSGWEDGNIMRGAGASSLR